MPQSAHSACVRCREHLLKGCGRTDGFWQSRGRVARKVFINRALARLPGNQAYGLLMGLNPKWQDRPPVKCSHCELRSTDARRIQRAYGARFESATRRLEQREADADNSPANAARVAGPGRFNFAARPNFANPRNHGYIRYLFAILHLNLGCTT
jgi:hypothetical protein